MTERPIIFSAPMVRALLSGAKTQTRRLLNPQPPLPEDFFGSSFALDRAVADGVKMYSQNDYERLPKHPTKWDLLGSVGVARSWGFPTVYDARWAIGDRAWVRETRAVHRAAGARVYCKGEGHPWGSPIYRATFGAMLSPTCEGFTRWLSPIHMPRWASRITLEITDVRVQRLWSISEEDVVAEGGEPCANGWWFDRDATLAGSDARAAYSSRWTRIHGPGAWAINPWVVALTFTVQGATALPRKVDNERGAP